MSTFYEINSFATIPENATLNDVYSSLSKSDDPILFVVNLDGKLTGTITDGDIRRFIQKNKIGLFRTKAKDISNKSPKYILLHDLDNINYNDLISYHVNYLPVVDRFFRIVKVLYIPLNIQKTVQQYVKILIMAGGKGTRLYPLTKIIPKPLVPYGNKTIIENIMEQFLNSGFDDFVLSVNYKKHLIKEYFSGLSYKVSYIEEDDFLGTAGSIYFLKDRIHDKPFFVANCDVLLKEDFYQVLKFHNSTNSDITIVSSLRNVSLSYGVLSFDDNDNLIDIIEKPNYRYYINTGIYLLNPSIIELLSYNEKLDMPQLISRAKSNGFKIKIYRSKIQFIDVGQWQYYKQYL